MLVVFAISFITLFTVAVNQAGPLHSSTRPPTCPPAPACDPSAWPAYWLGEPEYSAFQQFNQELQASYLLLQIILQDPLEYWMSILMPDMLMEIEEEIESEWVISTLVLATW